MTRRVILLAVAALSVGAPSVAVAAPFANRQYDGTWQKSQKSFHFRPYYMRESSDYLWLAMRSGRTIVDVGTEPIDLEGVGVREFG